jgi:hypothetical protein
VQRKKAKATAEEMTTEEHDVSLILGKRDSGELELWFYIYHTNTKGQYLVPSEIGYTLDGDCENIDSSDAVAVIKKVTFKCTVKLTKLGNARKDSKVVILESKFSVAQLALAEKARLAYNSGESESD